MYFKNQRKLIRAIADEMRIVRPEQIVIDDIDPNIVKINIGGRACLTLTVDRGIQYLYEFIPYAARLEDPSDDEFIKDAERLVDETLLALMKEDACFRKAELTQTP